MTTSGRGGVYPPGLVVGHVEEVHTEASGIPVGRGPGGDRDQLLLKLPLAGPQAQVLLEQLVFLQGGLRVPGLGLGGPA